MSFFRGLINKGLKHGLFQDINTENSQDIKDIYNSGVRALSKQDIQAAVETFKRIEDEHPSAAYNLGLIYLNGGGLYIPDYSLARKYFQLQISKAMIKQENQQRLLDLRVKGILLTQKNITSL